MIDRDAIASYIEDHRGSLIKIFAVALAVLVFSIIMLAHFGLSEERSAREAEAAQLAKAVPPDELWLLPDPLGMPDIQFSREPKERWSAQERDLWYDDPGAGEIGALREAGRKQIDDLLESVP